MSTRNPASVRSPGARPLLIGLLLIACTSQVVVAQWQRVQILPDGSAPRAMRFSHDTAYVATLYHGIWRSTDNGTSWQQITSHASAFDFDTILEFVVDGPNMAALSIANLLYSSDGGTTWARTPRTSSWLGPTPIALVGIKGNLVFVDQTEMHGIPPSNYPYNVVQAGVNASNWSSFWPIQNGTGIVTHSDTLFMTAGAVYLSTDGGNSWTPYNSGCFADLIINGSNWVTAGPYRDILYSRTSGKAWLTPQFSYDHGAVQGLKGLVRIGTTVLSVAKLYIGSDLAVQLIGSTDDGATWNLHGSRIPGSDALVLASDGKKVFVGTEAGLYVSSDTGSVWNLFGPPQFHGSPLVTSGYPTPSGMFVGTVAHGVIVSTDRGSTWSGLTNGLPAERVYSVTGSGGALFAGLPSGLYRSDEGGSSWLRPTILPLDTLLDLGIYGQEKALMIRRNPLWDVSIVPLLSTDGGTLWSTVIVPQVYIYYDQARLIDTRLFLPTMDGLVAYDYLRGTLDTTILHHIDIHSVCSPRAGLILATSDLGLHVSTDAGNTWTTRVVGLLPGRYLEAYGDSVFAIMWGIPYGTNDYILLSTDLGTTWQSFSDGYTGTFGQGIWLQNGMLFVFDGTSLFSRQVGPAASEAVSGGYPPVPAGFSLQQNFPNPFNGGTRIGYGVQGTGYRVVTLKVYDILGREVATLVNERKAPGGYVVQFDASGLASGVYLYRLTAGNKAEARTMILIK